MSCRFGSETDLAAYLLDPTDPEFAAFRDHWPSCPGCSREVARLARMEMLLRSAAPENAGRHPAEEQLLLFEESPGRLDPVQRKEIARHLTTCRTCSDELHALRSFEVVGSIESAARPAAAYAARRTWRSRPVLAAAAGIALTLAGLSVWLLQSMRTPESTPPAVAQRVEIPVIVQSEPTREPAAPPVPSAVETPPTLAPPERVAEAPLTAVARKPVQQTPAPAQPEPPAATRAKPTHEIAAKEPAPAPAPPAETPAPIVVAALDPASLPAYLPPAGAASGQRRFDGVVRGATNVATLLALAPDHVGRTAQAAPTLFFFVDRRSDAAMELSLVDPNTIEPLVEVHLAPPIAAGIHAVRLAGRGVALQPGVAYRWSVSLIRDAEHRAGDVVASGAIERVAAAVKPANTNELAKAGLFYDALAAVSDEVAAHPDDPQRRARRVALLEQVGLAQAAAFDRRRER